MFDSSLPRGDVMKVTKTNPVDIQISYKLLFCPSLEVFKITQKWIQLAAEINEWIYCLSLWCHFLTWYSWLGSRSELADSSRVLLGDGHCLQKCYSHTVVTFYIKLFQVILSVDCYQWYCNTQNEDLKLNIFIVYVVRVGFNRYSIRSRILWSCMTSSIIFKLPDGKKILSTFKHSSFPKLYHTIISMWGPPD